MPVPVTRHHLARSVRVGGAVRGPPGPAKPVACLSISQAFLESRCENFRSAKPVLSLDLCRQPVDQPKKGRCFAVDRPFFCYTIGVVNALMARNSQRICEFFHRLQVIFLHGRKGNGVPMLFKSSLLSEASGSVSGSTYSHNRYGMYIRNRSTPVNPNTDRQSSARSRFSQLAAYWNNDLTEAQRTAWRLYGSSVPMPNALGDSVYLTGFSHFLRSNCQQLQCLAAIVDDGPTIFTLPQPDSTVTPSISEAAQTVSFTFDTGLDWVSEDGAFIQVEMSQPRSPSRLFIGGPYRWAGDVPGNSTTPPTSPQTVPCPFVATEGQRVEIRFRIGRSDGRLSAPFSKTILVAA